MAVGFGLNSLLGIQAASLVPHSLALYQETTTPENKVNPDACWVHLSHQDSSACKARPSNDGLSKL